MQTLPQEGESCAYMDPLRAGSQVCGRSSLSVARWMPRSLGGQEHESPWGALDAGSFACMC